MTNEELAVLIQNGDESAAVTLWKQVERLVEVIANRRLFALNGCGGVDIDDLKQSGFIAMLTAARSFDPEKGFQFTTYLSNAIKTEFARATNYHADRGQKLDIIDRAISLYEPLFDNEGDEVRIDDTVRDPEAEKAFEAVELADMVAAVRKAVDGLADDSKSVLIERFFNGLTVKETAQKLNMSETQARRKEARALMRLRHPSTGKDLEKHL